MTTNFDNIKKANNFLRTRNLKYTLKSAKTTTDSVGRLITKTFFELSLNKEIVGTMFANAISDGKMKKILGIEVNLDN